MTIFVVLALSVPLHGRMDSKYDDPDTPKIRASFTVVPETDDIAVLRDFIAHIDENWGSQMRDRYKDYSDYELFLKEKSEASLAAAEKILEILTAKNSKEDISENLKSSLEKNYHGPKPFDSDTVFALKAKVMGYYHARKRTEESLRRFEEFAESLENDPLWKDMGIHARVYWFNSNFYYASDLPDDRQKLEHFRTTLDKLKEYVRSNSETPNIKHYIGILKTVSRQCAERIESGPETTVKKGTLFIPTFEFFNELYTNWADTVLKDASMTANWPQYYEREMTKYRILAADDPMETFRDDVKKLAESLKKQLDTDSIHKVGTLSSVAEEMDERVEASRLLLQTVRPIFAASKDEKISDYTIGFDIHLNALALIGQELEFEAVLLDGTKIDLKDYRGKVILLDYWNTGCGPCLGEFPMMKAMYENYHDKGFEIIGFSVDEDVEQLTTFIKKEELPWLNASEVLSKKQNLPDSREKYDINAYPTSILIGRDGKVIRADARGMVLAKELRELFLKQ